MKKQTRRNFIKSSTIGGIAVTAGLTGMIAESYAMPATGTGEAGSYSFKRNIPVDETVYDLVIAGGGPAGTGAAIAAARLGAKTLIIEATGCLGGMGTSGLVTAFDPMANGEEMLVGGIMREIVFRMYERGFLGPDEKPEVFTKAFHHWTGFHGEGYKLLLDEMAVEAGVELRFFTQVVDADVDSRKKAVNAVIQHNVEGLRYVRAKTFIDATGDAVLSSICGVPCREAGIDTPMAMPPTLCSYVANVDWSRAVNGGQDSSPLTKAIADGHFTQPDRHVPGAWHVGQTLAYFNTGHVFGTNAVNCASLTKAMIEGRRTVQEFISYYKKYVPGYENIELAATAPLLGVRESRRIVGEYELCYADYEARRHFPDQIGIFNKAVDIHVHDASEAEYRRYSEEFLKVSRLKPGEYFGIPYSILVPKGWSNLWTAGRCNSSDIKVHGSIRVQPAASMMGQAAGTAAVQSVRTGQPACDLNTATLVETLRNAGAKLPQEKLSEKMTRG
jgi:hypothetical protein